MNECKRGLKNKHVSKHKGFQCTLRIDNKIYYNIQGNLSAIAKHYSFDLKITNTRQVNRILFSIFYVLSQKVMENMQSPLASQIAHIFTY